MINRVLKSIFFLLISVFQILFIFKVDASSIPIEEVFSDIDSNYEYYSELQYMFDNWVIFPDDNWQFNPKKLLNRDEFVGIVMKVSCEECISPNVNYDLIKQYSNVDNLFFDLSKNNKYFYCVASAKDSWYVKWYDIWSTCENWNSKASEAPFCPENTIILEEALAVVMRASWILSNEDANIIRTKIYNWEITEELSKDVFPKNPDSSVYSFYPDFQKALNYQVIDYDNYWNSKTSTLIDEAEYLRPKQAITKEKFLQIAYVAMKWNSCIDREDSNIWLKMNIYDKECRFDDIDKCNLSSLEWNKKIYDFFADVAISWDDNISTKEQYIWRFYNHETWEEIKKYWKYLDNYDFLKPGDYKVYLRVISDNWNTSEVYNNINIWYDWQENNDSDDKGDRDLDNMKVSIEANPISWNSPLLVDFESITSSDNINSYEWDFWDWNSWYGKNPQHIFKEEWIYEVVLTVRDDDWNISDSNLYIKVGDINENLYLCSTDDIKSSLYWCKNWDLGVYSNEKENILNKNQNNNTDENNDNDNNVGESQKDNDSPISDSDNDWINDKQDLCPLIPWVQKNDWCPVLDKSCNVNSDCDSGYSCSTAWVCRPIEYSSTCEYSWGDLIYWNVACNSCPCLNTIDFNSTIRNCDIIFPAITSPDQTKIYSKWNEFEIK